MLLAGELDAYLEVSQAVLLTLDHQGHVSRINRAGRELLGREEGDILGLDWFGTFVSESARSRMRGRFQRAMAGGEESGRFHCPVISRSRGERLIAWDDAPIRRADGRVAGVVFSGLDITDRERNLARRERLLRELASVKFALDQSAIVATTNVTGVITAVNDKFCTISKYSREELLGQDHRIINSGYHDKEFFRNLWTTIAGGRIWKGEIRNRAKDGSLYWVDTTVVPFLDAAGKPYQYMAIRYEVTERREAEVRLRQQETLARIGEMSAVVAHEVRNPLAGISAALQVVASRLPVDGSERAVLDDIQERIGSLNRMVQDLLAFSRHEEPALVPCSLRSVVDEAAVDIRRDPRLTGVAIPVTGDDPTVALDRGQMHRVFVNVLLNAADAMGRRGEIEVKIAGGQSESRVVVADRGRGISPEVLPKIFEPFFTTKARGAGLGLATARRIVEAHGGTLKARPRAGGGAEVVITLPSAALIVRGQPDRAGPPARNAPPEGIQASMAGSLREPHAPPVTRDDG